MGIFPIYDSVMSHTAAQLPPASAPGATSLLSAEAVASLIRRLLQSVLRLAVKSGLRYPELDTILREELIRVARQEIDPTQRDNASKLSVMTGLHRKWVASQLIETTSVRSEAPAIQRSRTATSQVFERWAFEARRKPAMKSLPIAGAGTRKGFTEIAKSLVTDVHPRAILDELIRLGLVGENEGVVTLLADTFTPKGRSDELLALMNDNASAMLDTSVANVLKTRPLQLEQSIWGLGISIESADVIAAIASSQWRATHDALFKAISDAPEAAPHETQHRIRIGMYVNYEPIPAAAD